MRKARDSTEHCDLAPFLSSKLRSQVYSLCRSSVSQAFHSSPNIDHVASV